MSKTRRIVRIVLTALYIAAVLLTVAGFAAEVIREHSALMTDEDKWMHAFSPVYLFFLLLFALIALTVETELYFDLRYFLGKKKTAYRTMLNVLSPLFLCASLSLNLYVTVIGYSGSLYIMCTRWLFRAYLAARAVYLILRTRDAFKLL